MEKDYKIFSKGRRLERQFYGVFNRIHKIPRRTTVGYVVVLVARKFRYEDFPDRYMAERFFYNQLALALRGKLVGVRRIELWQEISTGFGIIGKSVSITKNGRAIETIMMWGDMECSVYEIGVKEPIGEDDPF